MKVLTCPLFFSSTLGHLATAHFIILNWVCIDFTCTLVSGPISFWSNLGKGCKPFTISTLSGFFFNGTWCLMTPQLQYSVWLHIHRLIYSGTARNSPVCVWCLCNTCPSDYCLGTHLPLLMVFMGSGYPHKFLATIGGTGWSFLVTHIQARHCLQYYIN